MLYLADEAGASEPVVVEILAPSAAANDQSLVRFGRQRDRGASARPTADARPGGSEAEPEARSPSAGGIGAAAGGRARGGAGGDDPYEAPGCARDRQGRLGRI